MESEQVRYYEFGEFRLDIRRRNLLKNGIPAQLTGRLYDLLLVLLQNEGKILDHEDLLDQVWDGMIVEQSNLKKGISALRQVLGENPNESLYIKTIPRRGYSFVATVRALPDEPIEAADVSEPTLEEQFRSIAPNAEIIIEEEVIEEFDDPRDSRPLQLAGSSSVSSRKFPSRWILLSTGGLFLVIVLLAGWRLVSAPKFISFSADNVKVSKLTTDGRAFSDGLSPDGKLFVYSTNEKDDLNSLWVKQIATGSTFRIVAPMPASFWSAIFSPDDNYVYYTLSDKENPAASGIYKIPSLGGTPELVVKEGMILAFTNDGKHFLRTQSTPDLQAEIILSDNDGSNEKVIAKFDVGYRVWSIQPSPDGKNVLVSLRNQTQDKVTYRLSEISLDSTVDNFKLNDILPEQEKAIRKAVWLPDRSSLLLMVREDNAELVQIWQYFPSTNDWKRVTNDDNFYANLSLTSDGRSFVSTQDTYLTTISDVPGGNSADARQIAGGSSHYIRAFWLDDQRILTSGIENKLETLSIMSPQGQVLKKLTPGGDGVRLEPRLPAGRQFVSFVSARSGTMQIWKVDLDGKNPTQMTNSNLQVYEGRVLSDGKTVVYIAYGKPAGWQILKQTADGHAVQLTKVEMDLLAISPDEKTFATFLKDPKTGKFNLTVASLDDGSILKTFGPEPARGSIVLAFTPDGKGLAYTITANGVGNVGMQPLDSGPPKMLTDFKSDLIYSFDWSPDGKNILVVRGKQLSDAVMIQSDPK
ncbi:MAG: winged helix-turn-helix domain-containing protein [Acidobacteriota bacterium]